MWEQGTHQKRIGDEDYQTIEPALNDLWRTLEARAKSLGIKPRRNFNQARTIRALVHVIGIYTPKSRLKAMNALIENYGMVPLPGHGRYHTKSLDHWLKSLGATFE